jgi:hypothetical protein
MSLPGERQISVGTKPDKPEISISMLTADYRQKPC